MANSNYENFIEQMIKQEHEFNELTNKMNDINRENAAAMKRIEKNNEVIDHMIDDLAKRFGII